MNIPKELLSNAQTVLHLAKHIEAMKKQALELKKVIGARKRGYFTPTEEEAMRHLLVSYWQTRAALFEIVLETKGDLNHWLTGRQKKYTRFMIGYAATLILVEGAQFLYKNYDNVPAIREKLNEPDPQFGIPADVYDTVQQSLTNPINAWKIQQAKRFYKNHEHTFKKIAKSNRVFLKLSKLIKALEPGMDIAKPEYAKITLRIHLRQLLHMITKSAINRATYALQEGASRMVSRIKIKPHKPELPKKIQKQLKALLQPGDVLITRKEFALTNYFLPGYWPHAALYIGDVEKLKKMGINHHKKLKLKWKWIRSLSEEPGRVLEALKDGVHIRSIETPFMCDAIAIIRPQIKWRKVKAAITRGLFHEGKPYDFDFNFTQSRRLVCTAVIYRSFEGIDNIKFKLTKRAGRLTLSAEDILTMALKREHFEPMAVYCPRKKKKIQTGNAMDRILKATIGKKI